MDPQDPQADQQTPEQRTAPQARRPERVDDVSGEATDARTSPGQDRSANSDDAIRFDGPRNAPSRDTQSTTTGPKVVSGMFFPAIILIVVAIVIILVLVL